MAQAILSTLCTACSTRLSPHSQTKLYQLRICHSMSLMPAGRVLAGGIGFTGIRVIGRVVGDESPDARRHASA